MSVRASEIVVGIDFGTTHSGVSWAVNGGAKVIRLIENWRDPTSGNPSKEKVPSVISYADGKPRNWGYEVGLNDESFKWIKILLEENHHYVTTVEPVQNSSDLLRKFHKTAQQVVADYLKLLWQYTLDDIRRFHPEFESTHSLRVVLTVPAIWSPAAKDKTRQAARLAGMPDPIKLVTEPEAAALATLKDRANDDLLKVGDAFVVCDAGGGTVDLISYKVEGLNSLRIKECAIGSGGLCGAVFLDARFEKHIATLVGEAVFSSIKERHRKTLMRNFEFGVKRSFSEKSDRDYSVDFPGVPDDPANGIIDDTIVIKKNTLRAIFDDVALQVVKLIADQIAEVSEKGLQVKSILLVGGFGANTYLHDRLQQSHANDGISVMQVTRAWSSICRGATMWGLEHPEEDKAITISSSREPVGATLVSRLSRYSYGLCFNEPFDPSRHLITDFFVDEKTGEGMARNQMTWLLKRGDEVGEGKILSTECSTIVDTRWWHNGFETFQTHLYFNNEVKPPTRKTSTVQHLCKVTFAADKDKLWLERSFKGADKQKLRRAVMTIIIVLGNATLDFVVVYRNEILTVVEAEYAEKFES